MRKTNRFIYAYEINWGNGLNLEYLKTHFPENRRFENFIRNKDSVSLVFLGEEDGISFFQLLKGKGTNITIIDFTRKTDIPHFLGNNEKVKNYGLLAFMEDKNILLTLFNHEAFGYSTGELCKYLKSKLNKDFGCEIITKEEPEDYTKKVVREAKNIIIKKAQRDYKIYEQRERGSSRKKLIKYTEGKELNFTLNRIRNLPENRVIAWINRIRRRINPDKIIVDTYTQGNIDLLDEIYLRFPCNVNEDEDGLAFIEDFKNEIKRIISQNQDDFEGY